MLQDVMRGRRTEIDYLNGYVVEQGRRVGVKTPFNEMIVDLLHQHGIGQKWRRVVAVTMPRSSLERADLRVRGLSRALQRLGRETSSGMWLLAP